MKKCALLLFSLAVFASCAFFLPALFGWGQHRYHADLVRQLAAPHLKLPDGKERFSKQEWDEFVELYAYYPDWGAGGAKSPLRTDKLWDYYLTSQVQYRIEGTHSLRATVQYFKLLLECLAAGENRKAALWAGCLTHVLGDAAAANHPPLLAYLTYGHGPLGLTVAPSGASIARNLDLLDVRGPCEDPRGKELIQEALKGYRPVLLGDTAEEAAVRLQLLLHDAWLTALQEEARIARGFEKWVGDRDPRGKELLLRGMARVIARCTRDTADVLYTANVLAQKKQTFDVEKALEKAHPRIAEQRKAIPLSQMSAYEGILKETSAAPAVGVFLAVPPIYWLSSGSVDLQFCYFMNLITGTLADQKLPYITFDLKTPPASLDPKNVPVVILPTYRQADGLATEKLEKMLTEYRRAGGRLLFVGGHPCPAIDPMTRHLVRSPDGDFFYPLKAKEMPGKKLLLAEQDGKSIRETIRIVDVMKDFDTRAFGAYVLKDDAPANLRPVVYLDAGEKRVAVSSGYIRDGGFEVIYAPWFFFMPGSLSEEKQLRKLDRPTLDPGGRSILKHLLALLKKDERS
jgi:hypothetical protein